MFSFSSICWRKLIYKCVLTLAFFRRILQQIFCVAKKNIAFGWNEVYFPPTRHTRWIIYFVCWREVNSRWPKILHQNEASCCTFCYLWIHVQIFNLWQIFRNHVEMNCMNSTRKDQRWNKLKAKRVGIMLECGSVKEIESSRSSVEAFAEKYNMTGLNSLSAIFQTKFF